MFCEIELRLFIPPHKRNRLAVTDSIYCFSYRNSLKTAFFSLSLSQFLFFIQEVDQSIGSFTLHHACV